MQSLRLMDETFDTMAQEPGRALRVIIAYNDVAAGHRAMHILADLGRSLGSDIAFQPKPWSFDLLSDADWHTVAAGDAVNADILIIATSSTNPLPPVVGRWAEAAISRKRGTDAAIIALFGPEDHPDQIDSPRLSVIRAAVQRAGLDFFAPTPRHAPDDSSAHVPPQARTITPLPDDILRHHPEPRWGINE